MGATRTTQEGAEMSPYFSSLLKPGDLVCFKPLMDKPCFDDQGIIISVAQRDFASEYRVWWFSEAPLGDTEPRLADELHLISEAP
jgi:hypothetical protein